MNIPSPDPNEAPDVARFAQSLAIRLEQDSVLFFRDVWQGGNTEAIFEATRRVLKSSGGRMHLKAAFYEDFVNIRNPTGQNKRAARRVAQLQEDGVLKITDMKAQPVRNTTIVRRLIGNRNQSSVRIDEFFKSPLEAFIESFIHGVKSKVEERASVWIIADNNDIKARLRATLAEKLHAKMVFWDIPSFLTNCEKLIAHAMQGVAMPVSAFQKLKFPKAELRRSIKTVKGLSKSSRDWNAFELPWDSNLKGHAIRKNPYWQLFSRLRNIFILGFPYDSNGGDEFARRAVQMIFNANRLNLKQRKSRLRRLFALLQHLLRELKTQNLPAASFPHDSDDGELNVLVKLSERGLSFLERELRGEAFGSNGRQQIIRA